jgi:hypothetical protein
LLQERDFDQLVVRLAQAATAASRHLGDGDGGVKKESARVPSSLLGQRPTSIQDLSRRNNLPQARVPRIHAHVGGRVDSPTISIEDCGKPIRCAWLDVLKLHPAN